MLRLYVTDPATALETAYTARLRNDKKFEPGTKIANGEAEQGEVLLDDPDFELDWAVEFASGRKVRLTEDASGAEKTLIVGRIGSKEFDHGALPLGRELSISIIDANIDLSGIPVHGFVRPSETGRVRALAVIAAYLNGSSSTALNPLSGRYARDSTVIASTYAQDAGNVTMPAETYDGTDPLSVLRACAEFENKRLGVYVNDNGTLALYYAPKDETAQLNCTIGVSDDPADFGDPDYLEPHWIAGPALHTDADELLSGALMIHPDGVTYDRRAAIENVHDRWEEAVYSQLPQGALELDALLDARELEQPRRQFAVQIGADRVHLIKAGMRIEVKRALASAAVSIFERIVSVHLAWLSEDEAHTYNVIVTLETPVKIASTWARPAPSPYRRVVGGVSTDFELTVVATAANGLAHMELWAGIAAHNRVYLWTDFDLIGPPYDSDLTHLYWYLASTTGYAVGGSFPVGVPITFVLGVAGAYAYAKVNGSTLVVLTEDMDAGVSSRIGVSGIATSGLPVDHLISVESIVSRAGVLDDFARTVGSGWGTASSGGVWAAGSGVDGTGVAPFTSSVNGSQGLQASAPIYGRGFHLPLTDAQLTGAPASAYYGESFGTVLVAYADGVASSWTLPYPTSYVPGTLVVYVDGVRQTATEVSATAGTFSLPWTPALGDQISASWRVPAVV